MESPDLVRLLLRQPRILRPYGHILLMSHMRANTSLLGHLLGSNPDIDGYYELHMGYHSRRSFLRQRLLHFRNHTPKARARYLFDKVLHDDHSVKLALFRNQKLLFALRSPRRTLPSIIALYRRLEPDHACATPEGAAGYYTGRVASLAAAADDADGGFLYFDADLLRSEPALTLSALTRFLELREPLNQGYDAQPLTGTERAGDSSVGDQQGKNRVSAARLFRHQHPAAVAATRRRRLPAGATCPECPPQYPRGTGR